jgi:hypothetical protein
MSISFNGHKVHSADDESPPPPAGSSKDAAAAAAFMTPQARPPTSSFSLSPPLSDVAHDHGSQLRMALDKAHLTLEKRAEALQAFYDQPPPEADDATSKAKTDATLARLHGALELAEDLYNKARDRLAAHQHADKQAATVPVINAPAVDQRASAHKEFQLYAKAIQGKLPTRYRSSLPNQAREWAHLIHSLHNVCGPDITTAFKLRLIASLLPDSYDAQRLTAFHEWRWEDCVNLIPTVLSGGVKALNSAQAYHGFRCFAGLGGVTAGQEIQRFHDLRKLVVGDCDADAFAVQLFLLSLAEPLRKQILDLYDIQAHQERGAADPDVLAFQASLGRADLVPQVPSAELVAKLTKHYNEDTHSPPMQALTSLMLSVCRDPPHVLCQRFWPTAAELAAAEKAFAPIASGYYMMAFTPSKHAAAEQQQQQPASYRAAVSGANANGSTTKPPTISGTAGDSTSGTAESKPRLQSDGPEGWCYIHAHPPLPHRNKACRSSANVHTQVPAAQMLPPVAATAPAAAPSPPATASGGRPPGPRTINPSHGNSILAIHVDELPHH